MPVAKYKYTPEDVAMLICFSDMTRKHEEMVISDLFKNHNEDIIIKYRNDFIKFRRAVKDRIIIFSINQRDYTEIQLILKELGIDAVDDNNSYDVLGTYFRIVKLKLLYTDISCYKLKAKTLINDFGYKRRSADLMRRTGNALKALNLKTYLKNYRECDLSEIKLDQMVMIRLG